MNEPRRRATAHALQKTGETAFCRSPGLLTGRIFKHALKFSLLACCATAVAAGARQPQAGKHGPSIEDYATIEAYVGKEEIPVYAFGYTYVYGVSPDLSPGVQMQEGNTNAAVKFRPKKSWEMESNLCGSTPAREPKTMWNDDQPLLPVHLIDGDPETAWSSRGGTVPDRQPEWIRIDLPAENTVASVALVCSQKWPRMRTGKQLPKELVVKLSSDARQWESVYEQKSFSGPDAGPSLIQFDPRRAKQAWVVDIFNGTEQELGLTYDGDQPVHKGIMIKDYPVFVRILVGSQCGAPERSGSR